MNIIFFSNSTWSIYNFRRNFLKKFVRKGYKVYVVSNKDYTTKFIKKIGCNFIDLNFNSLQKNFFYEIINIIKFIQIVIRIKPKIIFSFTVKPILYSTIISFFCNFKIINTFDGLGRLYSKKSLYLFLYMNLLKIFNKNTLKIFLVNSDNYYFFLKKKVVKKNKLELIKNGTGIDTKFYSYSKIKNGKIFLFLGRYMPSKGILEFCEAAKYLKKNDDSLTFMCAGNYDKNDKSLVLKSKLKGYKKYVSFYYNVKDIRKLIKKSTCVVLPSYYNEGLNRSLMESLSMGRPIITSDVPGCLELLDNEKNGFKIKPKDLKSLTKKITFFLNLKKNIIDKMSKNCRKFIIQNYSDKKIIDKYLKITDLL